MALSTSYKVTALLVQNRAVTQAYSQNETQKIFTCLSVSARDKKQEELKEEPIPGGWHDCYPSVLSVSRFLTGSPSPFLPAASSNHHTPPPPTAQVTQP